MNDYTSAVHAHPMYVSVDGDYGSAIELITFEFGQLTAEQWDTVAELDGLDRSRYIQAVLDNDSEVIAEYEN